ncbi:EamA family transporter RarD [Aurantiacibacter gangjinensis]|uniref:Membrane protein n=1 Tax=Aurantiacibacter gangjinensis TaxID=502682 RepID=A0A0G9MN54_9SPHN|nr:EamA family transporter RarD [Aurantiacibacter gangjinensis]APE28224.1 RarD protein [Aurantiacibacter gangjinensis]KLE32122.1 membrane protein [Aurantiacibacter gangjinensis]
MPTRTLTTRQALACGLATHAIWGTLPLYLILVDDVPPLEFVAWRTLFTLPICLALVAMLKQSAELRAILSNGKAMVTLFATSALIGLNWWIYIWAIQENYIYAASLGYYILPLLMMVMGLVFLKERLSRAQTVAVVLAGIGVGVLSTGALTTLWVSLSLALTFGFYGLLRKTVAAGPLTGLTIEATILLPLVAGYLGWVAATDGVAFGRDTVETLAIIGAGFVTATPLLLFANAARNLPYTVSGVLQFLAPSMIFVLGLTVFGEELQRVQLVCFILIWAGIALFSWDMIRNARRKPA